MSYTLTIPKFETLINFEINIPLHQEYAFHFLLGPNGCGKTLLAKSILGLNENVGYSSLYENNQDRIEISEPKLRRYLPQTPDNALFPQFSLNDNVFLLNKLFEIKSPIPNSDILKLLGVKSENQQVATLSVGQKKKLLMHFIINSLPSPQEKIDYPIVIVLDEPFAGIDVNFSPTISDMLNDVATKFLRSKVYFLIIEHETLITISTPTVDTKVTLRQGVDLRIVCDNKIVLR